MMSRDKSKDTGLAMVLILLLIAYYGHNLTLILPAIFVLLIAMIAPGVFSPLAYLWFGLSNIMGAIVSRILLTILFFFIVTPVGLIRRVSGADPMRFKEWKKERRSVLVSRNHLFTAKDLEKPY